MLWLERVPWWPTCFGTATDPDRSVWRAGDSTREGDALRTWHEWTDRKIEDRVDAPYCDWIVVLFRNKKEAICLASNDSVQMHQIRSDQSKTWSILWWWRNSFQNSWIRSGVIISTRSWWKLECWPKSRMSATYIRQLLHRWYFGHVVFCVRRKEKGDLILVDGKWLFLITKKAT